MKKALIVTLALVTSAAFAAPGMGHKGNPERHLDRMAETLELTDAQRGEVGTIFEQQHEKMTALHQETREQIDAVLTPEQREKAETLRAERKEKMEKRMEHMHKRMEGKSAE